MRRLHTVLSTALFPGFSRAARWRRCCAPVAVAALLSAGPAWANMEGYPAKEINFVINFGAGGNTDVTARTIGKAMEEVLKKPVIPVNKGGAQGTLGVGYLAKQKPDGYTLGLASYTSMTLSPQIMKLDYKLDDFEYIAGVARYRYGMVVRADSPYRNIADLVAASKTGKGVFYSSPAFPNSTPFMELAKQTGGKFEEITYKSGPETIGAVLGGQVDASVLNPSDVLPHIQAGKLRMIASASPMRWVELPEVPTIQEQGHNITADSWMGMAFPKGTPKALRDRMEQSVLAIMKTPAIAEAFARIGIDPVALSGAEYRQKLVEAIPQMREAAKSANLPIVNPNYPN
ncbi:Bug family tripartite tricarboxylate transporter substrate binding protein [Comamonas terrigena]|nr:tripartite tricarboxylate transporter substrate binding protein [Comamonas terrigena]SUY70819.1 Argininosuccinate lyase [Comamonas terrigena]